MALPPGIEVDELIPYLGAGATLPQADRDFLEFLLGGVCEYAAGHTGRRLSPNPASGPDVTETVTAHSPRFTFSVPDARSISEVKADDQPVAEADYTSYPASAGGTIVLLRLTVAARKVEITGQFGFTEVPVELRDAIYAHAARNYRERDAMYSDQVELVEGGVVSFFRRLPPRVGMIYDRYRVRAWGLA